MIRPGVRRLFRWVHRRRDQVAQEVDAEIAAHLAQRVEQLEALGWAPDAAEVEARRRFGWSEAGRRALIQEAWRRERRLSLRERFADLVLDLRFAWRTLLATPGQTTAIVVILALGVGANAAILGILDRLLLHGPEQVQAASELRRVYLSTEVPGRGTFTTDTFGYVTLTALSQAHRAFRGFAAYSYSQDQGAILGRAEGATRILPAYATASLFPLLGVHAALGRFFNTPEDRPGSPEAVVVLGDRLWRSRFAADPRVLGREVVLDGNAYRIIGIAPRGFTGVELGRVDAWLPMSLRGSGIVDNWQTTWNAQWLHIVGRLRSGVSAAAAQEELTAVFRAAYTGDEGPVKTARLSARPLTSDDDGQEAKGVAVSRWLAVVAFLVWLIANANVANLLMVRAVGRRREVAVRRALGISRGRLARLLLAESLSLAAAGGALALAMVPWVAKFLRLRLLPEVSWPRGPLEGNVVAAAVVLTLVSGVLIGVVPLLQGGGGKLLAALRTGMGEGGGRSSRLRRVLVAAQAAGSLVLLIGAGLFLSSLYRAENVDLGVDAQRVLAVSGSWARQLGERRDEILRVRKARSTAFYRHALERARQLPGVGAAAISVGTPFSSWFQVKLQVPGWDALPRLSGGGPYIQAVSPGYFATVGLRRLAGRVFVSGDHEGSEAVAIVSRTMAATLWPRGEAVGHCLHIGADSPPCARVVGVVEDAHHRALDEPPSMQYYIPLGQEHGFGGARLLVRPVAGELQTMIPMLRRALVGVDPSVLWIDISPLAERLAPELRPWRLGATVIGGLGLLALVIAALGLYSLVAQLLTSRQHELGVRSALGATGYELSGLVLRHGLGLVGAGLVGGTGFVLAVGGRLAPLLFHTSPRDPWVLAGAAALLLLVAFAASLGPARKAGGVDPVAALRSD